MKSARVLRLSLAALFLVLGIVPAAVGATCADPSPPSVGMSISTPDASGNATATINYSFPPWVSVRAVSLWSEGQQKAFLRPTTSTGTWLVPISVACARGPLLAFQAFATSCDRWSEPGYVYEDDAVVPVSSKPSLMMTVTGPDEAGHATASLTYDFPNTSSSGQRPLSLWIDGVQYAYTESSAQSGTWNIALDTNCWRDGPREFIGFATACKVWNDPDYMTNQVQTVQINSNPSVSLDTTGPDSAGVVNAVIDYSFPNTDNESRRHLTLWLDGAQIAVHQPTPRTGTWIVPLPACLASGSHGLQTYATVCQHWNEPGYSATDETSLVVVNKPRVSVSLQKLGLDPGTGRRIIQVTVDYDVIKPGGRVRVDLLKWVDANGQVYPGANLRLLNPSPPNGTDVFTFVPPSGARQLIVRATAEGCEVVTDDAAIECEPCENASANPVYYSDGNMKVDDGDPLPRVGEWSLTRTYDSDEQVGGLFGRGWTTLFDRRLIIDTDAVSVTTESNEVVTFREVGGIFRQTWPTTRRASGTLRRDAVAGTYIYRAPGSTVEAVFRASDGRLVRMHNLATAGEAAVAYDAQGQPAAFTDTATGVTWNLTVNAPRRVSSIAVAGRPDLVWTYAYDGAGNLTSVLAPGNATWRTYEYVANRMTASRDPLGNLIESHTYDAGGYAISSTGDVDEIANIEYNLPGSVAEERVTRVTYKNGAQAEYALRPIGGAMRPVHVSGGCSSCGARDKTYVRDARGRVVREQGANGYVTVRTYTDDGTQISEQRFLRPAGCDPASDANRCRIGPDALAVAALQSTIATIATSFEHGDPLWPDLPTAIATTSTLSTTGTRRETFTYDAVTGEVVQRQVIGWTGEPAVEQTRTTVNAFYSGFDGAAFTPGGSFSASWLTLAQPSGSLKSVDGPRSDVTDVTQYVYYPIDVSVPASLRGRLAAVRDPAAHVTLYESYDIFGNATRVVDANGVAAEKTFDGLGRLLTSTIRGVSGCDTAADPLCATDLTSSRAYAGAGSLEREQRSGGGVTVFTYDSRGRVASVSRGPSATDLREKIEYTYDGNSGKKSLEAFFAKEASSWVEKRHESYVYDLLDQLTATVHADATSVGYTYRDDGKLVGVRDENHTGANTTYDYDPAGRVSRVTQKLGSGTIDTEYTYDLHGNLKTVTDPNGNLTTYLYDGFGQLVKQTSPVTGITTYEYDVAGNLTSTIDANGATTSRTYDVLGRVLSATSSRVGTSPETVQWQYDDATAGRFGIGRLSQVNDPAGTTKSFYDRRGLLRREERSFPGVLESYITTFAHDANGNRTTIGYPSGMEVAYAFDFADRPISAASGATPLVASASYLPFGPPASFAFGNGSTQTMTYDNRYRIAQNRFSTPTATLAQYDYAYDLAGNITQIGDALDPGYNRDFGYDDLHRLVTANTGILLWQTGSYSYDAMGNMLALRLGEVIGGPDDLLLSRPATDRSLRSTTTDRSPRLTADRSPRLTTDASTRPLGRVTTFGYSGTTPKLSAVTNNDIERPVSYDAAGNELSYAIGRTWSARNLLASVTEDLEGTVHRTDYAYDGRGLRVKRSEPPAAGGNSSRYFLYSPELQLLSVTNDDAPNPWLRGPIVNAVSPSIRQEIVWFAGRPIAQIAPGNAPIYTVTDHLGTPMLQTDATATIVWRTEYEPYGNVYEMRKGVRTEQPLRLPGQEVAMTLEGQEENYNIFRWYRSGWGRYTQADPIGLEAGFNLYSYVEGNPIIGIDPQGLANVRVTKIGEVTYNTDRAYQLANPCNVSSGSGHHSCTERVVQDIGCVCGCKGTGFGMDVAINVEVRYHLAGGPTNRAPAPYWAFYRRHEDLHFNDLRRELTRYADSLEAQRFGTLDECNIACGRAIGGFPAWLNNWAVDSNRRLR